MARTLTATLLVLISGFYLLSAQTYGFGALTAETGRKISVQQNPRAVKDFALQLQDGRTVQLDELRGKVVLATFMYTSCRGSCPMVGAKMTILKSHLQAYVERGDVHFLSISFDPDNDNPEQLTVYANNFHAKPDFWWVSRPHSYLDDVLKFFEVTVIPVDDVGFIHNSAFYLFNRDMQWIDVFDDQQYETILAAIKNTL